MSHASNESPRKLIFILGTAAELIKVYPVYVEAEKRGYSCVLVVTGQSPKNLFSQLRDFNISSEKVFSVTQTTHDLGTSAQALRWFAKSLFVNKRRLIELLKGHGHNLDTSQDLCVVHGDTLSTLIGTLWGRKLGCRVVHIEAGMRSGSLTQPFPEEINRRLVSKLAHFHMAPDIQAAKDLNKEGIISGVTVTGGNTVVDALFLARNNTSKKVSELNFGLVNLHRYENLNSKRIWNEMIDIVAQAAIKRKLIFVLMPLTEEKLKNDPVARKKLEDSGVRLVKRMPFSEFVQYMAASDFLITDGGSNQQECFHLGKPCLLLRSRTESREGLGRNVILSDFKENVIQSFLAAPESFRFPEVHPERRPTDVILDVIDSLKDSSQIQNSLQSAPRL